jgi:hypothetical protein
MVKIKQKALHQVRLYPSTYKRLKIRAAKLGNSFAELVDTLSKKI